MSDIEAKRAFVAGISSSPGWKKKVLKMSEAQVVAIYLKEQAKTTRPKPVDKTEKSGDDLPF